jgi:hypothetical protein
VSVELGWIQMVNPSVALEVLGLALGQELPVLVGQQVLVDSSVVQVYLDLVSGLVMVCSDLDLMVKVLANLVVG